MVYFLKTPIRVKARRTGSRYAFLGAYQGQTNAAIHPYTIPNFGGIGPSSSRLVVCFADGRTGNVTLTSASINGVNATISTSYVNTGFGTHVMFYAVVPSGTGPFAINLTWSAASQGGGLVVYCFDGLTSNTPQQTATPSTTGSITLTPPSGRSFIIAYHCNRGGTGDIVFGGTLGLMEDMESLAFTDYRIACASKLSTTNTSGTITAATGSPLSPVTMAAVFQ